MGGVLHDGVVGVGGVGEHAVGFRDRVEDDRLLRVGAVGDATVLDDETGAVFTDEDAVFTGGFDGVAAAGESHGGEPAEGGKKGGGGEVPEEFSPAGRGFTEFELRVGEEIRQGVVAERGQDGSGDAEPRLLFGGGE